MTGEEGCKKRQCVTNFIDGPLSLCENRQTQSIRIFLMAKVTKLPQSHYKETNNLTLQNNVRIGLAEQKGFQSITKNW